MVDIKAAVNSAYSYLREIQELVGGKFEDLRLEEVELSEDKRFWHITLGYDLPVKVRVGSQLEEMLISQTQRKQEFQREYKLFKVNAETGEVESMKIRKV